MSKAQKQGRWSPCCMSGNKEKPHLSAAYNKGASDATEQGDRICQGQCSTEQCPASGAKRAIPSHVQSYFFITGRTPKQLLQHHDGHEP
eukprot:1134319-Pelagomonas_calceolata.AAC.3